MMWFIAVLVVAQSLAPSFAFAASERDPQNRILLCTPSGAKWVEIDQNGQPVLVDAGNDHDRDCGVCVHGYQAKSFSVDDPFVKFDVGANDVLFAQSKTLVKHSSGANGRIRAPPV